MVRARVPGRLFSLLLLALAALQPSCRRAIPPEQREADELMTRAREAFDLGRLRESRSLLADAHVLDARLGRTAQTALQMELLAQIAARGGDLDSAFRLYDAAAAGYRSVGDKEGARRMTLATAALHRASDADETAADQLAEALRVARLFKDSTGAREVLGALLPAARTVHRGDADALLREFLEEAQGRGDAAGLARGHLEAARAAAARGQEQQRAEDLLRALTFADRSGDSLLAIRILAELADAHIRLGNTREGFETFTAALVRSDATTGAKRLRMELLTRVGNVYLRLGTPADAVRFYRAALEAAMASGDRLLEGYLFVQLGHCDAAAGAAEDAVQKYRSAFDLFDGLRLRQGAAYALTALGGLAEKRRQYVDALQYYQRAVAQTAEVFALREPQELTADCESTLPGGSSASAGEGAISLLLQTGRGDEAFRLADAHAARARTAALTGLRLSTGDRAADSLLTLLAALRHRRAGLDRALAALVSGDPAAEDLLGELTARIADADRRMLEAEQILRETAPVTSPVLRSDGLPGGDAQALVPPGSALLLPVLTSRSLYLLWMSAAGLTVEVAAVGRDQLLRQAGEFSAELARRVTLEDSAEAVRARSDRRAAELSDGLYSALVRPVERLLGMTGPLYVVLPPELDGLPYHALGRAAGGAVRRTVIEQAAVHYLPSAAALRVDRRPPRSRYQLVAMGHPGRTEWDVEYELRDIRAFDKDVRLYFGPAAVPETLRAARGDVLHLALDTQYGIRAPGNARIFFSDGRTPDGARAHPWGALLTIPTASLIILSDLGEHVPGKNPVLAQVLLMTRTPAVVLQEYTAHRRSRKIFGEHLYTALIGGAAPDAAFRQALLQMQKTPASAGQHHWGVFSFWGK